jgi:hypothetical protein
MKCTQNCRRGNPLESDHLAMRGGKLLAEVHGSDSGSCSVGGVGISGAEPSGFGALVYCCVVVWDICCVTHAAFVTDFCVI